MDLNLIALVNDLVDSNFTVVLNNNTSIDNSPDASRASAQTSAVLSCDVGSQDSVDRYYNSSRIRRGSSSFTTTPMSFEQGFGDVSKNATDRRANCRNAHRGSETRYLRLLPARASRTFEETLRQYPPPGIPLLAPRNMYRSLSADLVQKLLRRRIEARPKVVPNKANKKSSQNQRNTKPRPLKLLGSKCSSSPQNNRSSREKNVNASEIKFNISRKKFKKLRPNHKRGKPQMSVYMANYAPSFELNHDVVTFCSKYKKLAIDAQKLCGCKLSSICKKHSTRKTFKAINKTNLEDTILKWISKTPFLSNYNFYNEQLMRKQAAQLAKRVDNLLHDEYFIPNVRDETKKWLNNLPIKYPEDYNEANVMMTKAIEELIKSLENPDNLTLLEKEISDWIKRLPVSNKNDGQMDRLFQKAVKKIKPLVLEQPLDKEKHENKLKNLIEKILESTNLEYIENEQNARPRIVSDLVSRLRKLVATDVLANQKLGGEVKQKLLHWLNEKPGFLSGKFSDSAENLMLVEELIDILNIMKQNNSQKYRSKIQEYLKYWLQHAAMRKNIFLEPTVLEIYTAELLKIIYQEDLQESEQISLKYLQNLINQWLPDIFTYSTNSQDQEIIKKKVKDLSKALIKINYDDHYEENAWTEVENWLSSQLTKLSGSKIEQEKYKFELISNLLEKLSYGMNLSSLFGKEVSEWVDELPLERPTPHQKDFINELVTEKLRSLIINQPPDKRDYDKELQKRIAEILPQIPFSKQSLESILNFAEDLERRLKEMTKNAAVEKSFTSREQKIIFDWLNNIPGFANKTVTETKEVKDLTDDLINILNKLGIGKEGTTQTEIQDHLKYWLKHVAFRKKQHLDQKTINDFVKELINQLSLTPRGESQIKRKLPTKSEIMQNLLHDVGDILYELDLKKHYQDKLETCIADMIADMMKSKNVNYDVIKKIYKALEDHDVPKKKIEDIHPKLLKLFQDRLSFYERPDFFGEHIREEVLEELNEIFKDNNIDAEPHEELKLNIANMLNNYLFDSKNYDDVYEKILENLQKMTSSEDTAKIVRNKIMDRFRDKKNYILLSIKIFKSDLKDDATRVLRRINAPTEDQNLLDAIVDTLITNLYGHANEEETKNKIATKLKKYFVSESDTEKSILELLELFKKRAAKFNPFMKKQIRDQTNDEVTTLLRDIGVEVQNQNKLEHSVSNVLSEYISDHENEDIMKQRLETRLKRIKVPEKQADKAKELLQELAVEKAAPSQNVPSKSQMQTELPRRVRRVSYSTDTPKNDTNDTRSINVNENVSFDKLFNLSKQKYHPNDWMPSKNLVKLNLQEVINDIFTDFGESLDDRNSLNNTLLDTLVDYAYGDENEQSVKNKLSETLKKCNIKGTKAENIIDNLLERVREKVDDLQVLPIRKEIKSNLDLEITAILKKAGVDVIDKDDFRQSIIKTLADNMTGKVEDIDTKNILFEIMRRNDVPRNTAEQIVQNLMNYSKAKADDAEFSITKRDIKNLLSSDVSSVLEETGIEVENPKSLEKHIINTLADHVLGHENDQSTKSKLMTSFTRTNVLKGPAGIACDKLIDICKNKGDVCHLPFPAKKQIKLEIAEDVDDVLDQTGVKSNDREQLFDSILNILADYILGRQNEVSVKKLLEQECSKKNVKGNIAQYAINQLIDISKTKADILHNKPLRNYRIKDELKKEVVDALEHYSRVEKNDKMQTEIVDVLANQIIGRDSVALTKEKLEHCLKNSKIPESYSKNIEEKLFDLIYTVPVKKAIKDDLKNVVDYVIFNTGIKPNENMNKAILEALAAYITNNTDESEVKQKVEEYLEKAGFPKDKTGTVVQDLLELSRVKASELNNLPMKNKLKQELQNDIFNMLKLSGIKNLKPRHVLFETISDNVMGKDTNTVTENKIKDFLKSNHVPESLAAINSKKVIQHVNKKTIQFKLRPIRPKLEREVKFDVDRLLLESGVDADHHDKLGKYIKDTVIDNILGNHDEKFTRSKLHENFDKAQISDIDAVTATENIMTYCKNKAEQYQNKIFKDMCDKDILKKTEPIFDVKKLRKDSGSKLIIPTTYPPNNNSMSTEGKSEAINQCKPESITDHFKTQRISDESFIQTLFDVSKLKRDSESKVTVLNKEEHSAYGFFHPMEVSENKNKTFSEKVQMNEQLELAVGGYEHPQSQCITNESLTQPCKDHKVASDTNKLLRENQEELKRKPDVQNLKNKSVSKILVHTKEEGFANEALDSSENKYYTFGRKGQLNEKFYPSFISDYPKTQQIKNESLTQPCDDHKVASDTKYLFRKNEKELQPKLDIKILEKDKSGSKISFLNKILNKEERPAYKSLESSNNDKNTFEENGQKSEQLKAAVLSDYPRTQHITNETLTQTGANQILAADINKSLQDNKKDLQPKLDIKILEKEKSGSKISVLNKEERPAYKSLESSKNEKNTFEERGQNSEQLKAAVVSIYPRTPHITNETLTQTGSKQILAADINKLLQDNKKDLQPNINIKIIEKEKSGSNISVLNKEERPAYKSLESPTNENNTLKERWQTDEQLKVAVVSNYPKTQQITNETFTKNGENPMLATDINTLLQDNKKDLQPNIDIKRKDIDIKILEKVKSGSIISVLNKEERPAYKSLESSRNENNNLKERGQTDERLKAAVVSNYPKTQQITNETFTKNGENPILATDVNNLLQDNKKDLQPKLDIKILEKEKSGSKISVLNKEERPAYKSLESSKNKNNTFEERGQTHDQLKATVVSNYPKTHQITNEIFTQSGEKPILAEDINKLIQDNEKNLQPKLNIKTIKKEKSGSEISVLTKKERPVYKPLSISENKYKTFKTKGEENEQYKPATIYGNTDTQKPANESFTQIEGKNILDLGTKKLLHDYEKESPPKLNVINLKMESGIKVSVLIKDERPPYKPAQSLGNENDTFEEKDQINEQLKPDFISDYPETQQIIDKSITQTGVQQKVAADIKSLLRKNEKDLPLIVDTRMLKNKSGSKVSTLINEDRPLESFEMKNKTFEGQGQINEEPNLTVVYDHIKMQQVANKSLKKRSCKKIEAENLDKPFQQSEPLPTLNAKQVKKELKKAVADILDSYDIKNQWIIEKKIAETLTEHLIENKENDATKAKLHNILLEAELDERDASSIIFKLMNRENVVKRDISKTSADTDGFPSTSIKIVAQKDILQPKIINNTIRIKDSFEEKLQRSLKSYQDRVYTTITNWIEALPIDRNQFDDKFRTSLTDHIIDRKRFYQLNPDIPENEFEEINYLKTFLKSLTENFLSIHEKMVVLSNVDNLRCQILKIPVPLLVIPQPKIRTSFHPIYKNTQDSVRTIVKQWVESLPHGIDKSPEEIENKNIAQQNIAEKLIEKYDKLCLDPEIFNDIQQYAKVLEQNLDEILSNFPQTPGLTKNYLIFKKKLIDNMLDLREKTRMALLCDEYEQQLHDTILKSLPIEHLSPQQRMQLEIFRNYITDAFIDMYVASEDKKQKQKFQELLKEKISSFCEDNLSDSLGTPPDPEELSVNLYLNLLKVPLPDDESLQAEIEMVKIRKLIKETFEIIPTSYSSHLDQIQMINLIRYLSKRIYDTLLNNRKQVEDIKFEEKAQEEVQRVFQKISGKHENSHIGEISKTLAKSIAHKKSKSDSQQSISIKREDSSESHLPEGEVFMPSATRNERMQPTLLTPRVSLTTEDQTSLTRNLFQQSPSEHSNISATPHIFKPPTQRTSTATSPLYLPPPYAIKADPDVVTQEIIDKINRTPKRISMFLPDFYTKLRRKHEDLAKIKDCLQETLQGNLNSYQENLYGVIEKWLESLPMDKTNFDDKVKHDIVEYIIDRKINNQVNFNVPENDHDEKILFTKMLKNLTETTWNAQDTKLIFSKLDNLWHHILEVPVPLLVKQQSVASISSDPIYENVYEILENYLKNWAESLPIDFGDSPEEIENNKISQQHIVKKIIEKFKKDNIILQDSQQYVKVLEENLEDLLKNSPRIARLIESYPIFKKKLIDNMLDLRKKIKSTKLCDEKQLNDTMLKSVPIRKLDPKQRTQFEILKNNLADALIDMHGAGEDENQIQKFKNQLKERISNFCEDYLKDIPNAPVDREKIIADLCSNLLKVPLSQKERLQAELQMIKIRNIIKEALEIMPLKKISNLDHVDRQNFIKKLSKRLHNTVVQNQVDNQKYQALILEEVERVLQKLYGETRRESAYINEISKENMFKSKASRNSVPESQPRMLTENPIRSTPITLRQIVSQETIDVNKNLIEAVKAKHKRIITTEDNNVLDRRRKCPNCTHKQRNFFKDASIHSIRRNAEIQTDMDDFPRRLPPCFLVREYIWQSTTVGTQCSNCTNAVLEKNLGGSRPQYCQLPSNICQNCTSQDRPSRHSTQRTSLRTQTSSKKYFPPYNTPVCADVNPPCPGRKSSCNKKPSGHVSRNNQSKPSFNYATPCAWRLHSRTSLDNRFLDISESASSSIEMEINSSLEPCASTTCPEQSRNYHQHMCDTTLDYSTRATSSWAGQSRSSLFDDCGDYQSNFSGFSRSSCSQCFQSDFIKERKFEEERVKCRCRERTVQRCPKQSHYRFNESVSCHKKYSSPHNDRSYYFGRQCPRPSYMFFYT